MIAKSIISGILLSLKITCASDASFEDNSIAFECPICRDDYGPAPSESVPIVNACGHTQCRSCLAKIKTGECPECKQPMAKPGSKEIINYAILSMIESIPQNVVCIKVWCSICSFAIRGKKSVLIENGLEKGYLLRSGGGKRVFFNFKESYTGDISRTMRDIIRAMEKDFVCADCILNDIGLYDRVVPLPYLKCEAELTAKWGDYIDKLIKNLQEIRRVGKDLLAALKTTNESADRKAVENFKRMLEDISNVLVTLEIVYKNVPSNINEMEPRWHNNEAYCMYVADKKKIFEDSFTSILGLTISIKGVIAQILHKAAPARSDNEDDPMSGNGNAPTAIECLEQIDQCLIGIISLSIGKGMWSGSDLRGISFVPTPSNPTLTGFCRHSKLQTVKHDSKYIMLEKISGNGRTDMLYKPFDIKEGKYGPKIHGAMQRLNAAVAAAGSKFVFIGGCKLDGINLSNEVTLYDLDTGDDKTLVSLGVPRDKPAAIFHNGKIYAIGGLNYHDGALATVEAWSFDERRWKRLADLNHPRYRCSLVSYRGNLMVLGGETKTGRENAGRYEKHGYVKEIEIYDELLDRWHDFGEMHSNRTEFGATVYDERIFIAGGENEDGCALNDVLSYNPITKIWRRVAEMPSDRKNCKLLAVKNDYDGKKYLLVLGDPNAKNEEYAEESWSFVPKEEDVYESLTSNCAGNRVDRRVDRRVDKRVDRREYAATPMDTTSN